MARHLGACPRQRLGAAGDGDRAQLCQPAGRLGADGDRLRLARPRILPDPVASEVRHERRARCHHGGRRHLHRHQSAVRPALQAARPEGAMSSQAENIPAAGWRAWLLSASPASRKQARLGRAYIAWLTFRSNPLAVLGLAIVVGLILVAVFAPLIAPYHHHAQVLPDRLQSFHAADWFGTDELRRDIFSRIVYGPRLPIARAPLRASVWTSGRTSGGAGQ